MYGEQRYRQEYEAEFVDDEKAYFPSSLLRECVHYCKNSNDCSYCELFSSDIALLALLESIVSTADTIPVGKGDLAAFVIVEKNAGVLRVVHVKTFLAKENIPDDNIYTRFTLEISGIHKTLKMRRIYVDQTGLGNPIIEQCRDQNLPAMITLPYCFRISLTRTLLVSCLPFEIIFTHYGRSTSNE